MRQSRASVSDGPDVVATTARAPFIRARSPSVRGLAPHCKTSARAYNCGTVSEGAPERLLSAGKR
jgi:hypothetical protein